MCDGGVQSGNTPNSLCVRRTRNPLKLGPRLAYVPRPELFSAVLNHFFEAFRARFDPALVQGTDEEHPAALRMPSTPHARCAIARTTSAMALSALPGTRNATYASTQQPNDICPPGRFVLGMPQQNRRRLGS